jgi:hypothetical protein
MRQRVARAPGILIKDLGQQSGATSRAKIEVFLDRPDCGGLH